MKKQLSVLLAVLVLSVYQAVCAPQESSQSAPLEKSQSPDGSFALSVITSPTNAERRLALLSLETKAVLAEVLLPMTAPAAGQSKTTVL